MSDELPNVTFLLEILECINCRGELDFKRFDSEVYLACRVCNALYQVQEGVPIMLEGETMSNQNSKVRT